MNTPVLSTKLFIPKPQKGLVVRKRLFKQLDKGLDKKLTLISAPAGFGKSTLLITWVHQIKNKIAWISFDKGDESISQFFTYFISAINRIDNTTKLFGAGCLELLKSPQPPSCIEISSILINEIAEIGFGITIVLDDYHYLESSEISECMRFLIENQPENLHLIIATRNDPQLPIPSLRAKGEIIELRGSDLRFTTQEAIDYLKKNMGLDLTLEEIKKLEFRTEGWIAGLQMASIFLQGQDDSNVAINSFAGTHRFILDYLISEVLEKQSNEIQDFLLMTSILDRLSASLCDKITGFNHSQKLLRELETKNLFIIPLDCEGTWFRYHHLFSELLQQQMRQKMGDQIGNLQVKASVWYEKNGYIEEAIEYAVRSSDFMRSANLLETHVDFFWQRGDYRKLRNWIERIPSEVSLENPDLCILCAWHSFTSGELDKSEYYLNEAERNLTLKDTINKETSLVVTKTINNNEKINLLGRITTLRAYLSSYRGDIPQTIASAEQALRLLTENDLTWRATATIVLGDSYEFSGEVKKASDFWDIAVKISKKNKDLNLTMIANIKLAINYRERGYLQKANEICKQTLEMAAKRRMSKTVNAGWMYAIWADILAELNQLEEASLHAQNGINLTKRGRDVALIGSSMLYMIRVYFSCGKYDAAQNSINEINRFSQDYDIPPFIMQQISNWQVRVWLKNREVNRVSLWTYDFEKSKRLNSAEKFVVEENIIYARVLIALEREMDAIHEINALLPIVRKGERTSKTIEMLILLTLAYYSLGKNKQAVTSITEAINLASKYGYKRIFIDEGPLIETILLEAREQGNKSKEYIDNLILDIRDDIPDQKNRLSQRLVEPLSEREIDVLKLMAEGLTYKQIASKLFLTHNTIKSHTHTIYQKLEVNNRTKAIEKAKSLSIIS